MQHAVRCMKCVHSKLLACLLACQQTGQSYYHVCSLRKRCRLISVLFMESCINSQPLASPASALLSENRLPSTQVLDKSPASLYMDSAGPEPGAGGSTAADSRHATLPLWHVRPR